MPLPLSSAVAARIPLSVSKAYDTLTQSLQQVHQAIVGKENTAPPQPLPAALRSLTRAKKAFERAGYEGEAEALDEFSSIHFDLGLTERARREIVALPVYESRRVDFEYGLRYVEKAWREVGEEVMMVEELEEIVTDLREREEGGRAIRRMMASTSLGEEEMREVRQMAEGVERLLREDGGGGEEKGETREEMEARVAEECEEESRKRVEAIERSAMRVHGRVSRKGCVEL
ncbi:uncharacterized protein LTR77_007398 [Saxophila tyrrhenica]|uniref:Uncharacterized protein n=1 Tax=Saxophila tyrrhenica TaxID=1690608 RepID=A0AAV9P4F7_9PEZI|nr:hypothetical protein LTR77_007398 [Saxophila tyrrhenica]